MGIKSVLFYKVLATETALVVPDVTVLRENMPPQTANRESLATHLTLYLLLMAGQNVLVQMQDLFTTDIAALLQLTILPLFQKPCGNVTF